MALAWSVTGVAAQQSSCRWVGNGAALRCDDEISGGPTLSTWQGGAWTTAPADAGGLSTYGSSYPPSPVTPAGGYAAASWLGNTLSQTSVVYGPGDRSRAINCNTAYAATAWYTTCR